MKVFKFKKYKDGYEDGTQGATPRCSLEIEAFFESQGMGWPVEPDASVVDAGTSLITLSSIIALPTTGLPSDVLTVRISALDAPTNIDHPAPSSEASLKGKVSV